MNNFTKEELMSLEFCIEVASGEDFSIRDSRKELLKKIQSMIDNYCEHEEIYEDFDYAPNRCKKCKNIVD